MNYSSIKISDLIPNQKLNYSLLFQIKPEIYFALKGTTLTENQIANLEKWDIKELFKKSNDSL